VFFAETFLENVKIRGHKLIFITTLHAVSANRFMQVSYLLRRSRIIFDEIHINASEGTALCGYTTSLF